MASPYRRLYSASKPSPTEENIYQRIGEAYQTAFPWQSGCKEEMAEWIKLLADSRDTRPEYVYLMSLPAVAALYGPLTSVKIGDRYSERLNLYITVLGESGAGKSSAFGLTLMTVKTVDDIVLQSSFSRSGLLAHLAAQDGKCIISYEEMDSFFTSVNRGQKEGTSDRSFYCELFDGTPQTLVRATNDGKKAKVVTTDIGLCIAGFHQPQPFLKENFDVVTRRDGFIERFLIACPMPKRLLPEEVSSANEQLNNLHYHLHDCKELYKVIHGHHLCQREYRFSPDALVLYNKEVADQAEAFNAMIEQRMLGGCYEEASSKYIRIFIKLAGILHVLESTFTFLSGGTVFDIPEMISKETTKRALELTLYSQQQKEVLFKEQDIVQVQDLDETVKTYLCRKVLLHPGVFVTKRNLLKTVNTKKRMEAQLILSEVMQELEEHNFGHYRGEIKTKCFVKNVNVKDEDLRKFSIGIQDYLEANEKTDKHLSNHQKILFQGLNSE